MMTRKKILVAIALTQAILSCGLGNSENDRQEVLDRLRALGVNAAPVVSQIPDSDQNLTTQLTIYAAVPGETAVSVEAWQNPNKTDADIVLKTSDFVFDANNTSHQDFGGIRLLTIHVKAKVPTASEWKKESRGGTVQYGFKLSTDSRTEYISGAFLAYRSGQPELAWQAPSLKITTPLQNSVVKKDDDIELIMDITNPQDELLLPSWFVPNGEIFLRRATSTTWKPKETGSGFVFATIRGRDSLGFAIQAIPLTIQE